MSDSPIVLILAGPNGAGKSTSAQILVKDKQFSVNADDIALELAATDGGGSDIQAGRMAISMIERLSMERKNFAIETTLASRTLAPKIRTLKQAGYRFHLIFFWLPDPEFAINRVAARVRMGGHGIPEATIRRRYWAGLANFFNLYQPIADDWQVYANLDAPGLLLVAEGTQSNMLKVYDQETWRRIQQRYEEGKIDHGSKQTRRF